MNPLPYAHLARGAEHELSLDGTPLSRIARDFGTPTYVYARSAIAQAYSDLTRAFGDRPHQICYAVKANSNLAILALLARLGAGFDIVSGGELQRVLAAGGAPHKIVFSGVGKRRDEIAAALEAGIGCLNVESAAELSRVSEIAREMDRIAPISLRVNPDVDAKTHPYISTGLKDNKFGIPIAHAPALYRQAARDPHLSVVGIDCHIGSQLTDVTPFSDAAARVLALLDQLVLEGIEIKHLDLGGGLGIRYTDETPPDAADWVRAVVDIVDAHPIARHLPIYLEPGRFLVGPAGVLLTRVEYLKPHPDDGKSFAIVDAAMNDLMRPALYSSVMAIEPVTPHATLPPATWEIVGPVCETGDFLGHARNLALAPGDLLAVLGAGAYGFSMASNYNTRGRPAEVLIDAGEARLVRARETVESLWANEMIPDTLR
ncbi:diaminopimelate decarboxylase [Halothiobacillus diazotrophicus]|uniref:Diaminopimelate decarboxylase n=1 Tax=Halothiobacillus diazotrophicus TaxID=1860122 RepID=A0A191ZI47_9GAMM|nr:diaminopimelate decarboxylase [Halothiobacillus diazotrophicus]ANJ67571.1 diaminopimelate decarboxylase [Halothiobacillus diazotrophicus]